MGKDERTSIPQEGEWFEVDPKNINRELFKEERKKPEEECTRQLILEALAAMDDNPKYQRCFETLIPKRTWVPGTKNVGELKELASELGDKTANWIEQALEWAQLITDGISWEDICKKPDKLPLLRFVIWKNGLARAIGGAQKTPVYANYSMATVFEKEVDSDGKIGACVPKVVRYKE